MTREQYEQRYYCNCPRCSELPTRYRRDNRAQWALCSACSIRWFIGKAVIEDCEEDSDGALGSLTQVLV